MVNIFDFASDTNLFKKLEVNDLLFTEYKCLETKPIFQIWSHYNYFVYVLSGQKKWETNQGEYLVNTGESIFVKKGASIIHKFYEVDFCALIMFVPDDFIVHVCQSQESENIPPIAKESDAVMRIHLDETLSAYFKSVFSYFLKSEHPPKNLLEIKFKELILNLICSSDNQLIHHYFRSLCHQKKSSLREMMEANFTFNLKLEEFARLSGRSLSAFKRDFTDTFLTTPGKWLLKKRLSHARRLLESSDGNMNQVAYESGFESPSHFIQVFKKEYGTTPLQYKKDLSFLKVNEYQ